MGGIRILEKYPGDDRKVAESFQRLVIRVSSWFVTNHAYLESNVLASETHTTIDAAIIYYRLNTCYFVNNLLRGSGIPSLRFRSFCRIHDFQVGLVYVTSN